MTTANASPPTYVTSADGTRIAYWTTGEGPPLVLVHGTTADHTRWAPVMPYLEPYFTVHAIDRRGRGESGDAADYAVGREYEDVAAVVEAVATGTRTAVNLLGHSFGGTCAFGAATRTSHLRRLVLYEGWPRPHPEKIALPADVRQRMEDLLSAGDREAVLEVFFREIVRMPEDEFVAYRALPVWQARIAAAHTIAREEPQLLDAAEAGRVTVPVLMLVGGDSPAAMQGDHETVAAVLPDARVSILEGQQHIAIDRVPKVFAQRVVEFLLER